MSEMDGNLMSRINNLWSGLDIVEADVGTHTDAICPTTKSYKRTFLDNMSQQVFGEARPLWAMLLLFVEQIACEINFICKN